MSRPNNSIFPHLWRAKKNVIEILLFSEKCSKCHTWSYIMVKCHTWIWPMIMYLDCKCGCVTYLLRVKSSCPCPQHSRASWEAELSHLAARGCYRSLRRSRTQSCVFLTSGTRYARGWRDFPVIRIIHFDLFFFERRPHSQAVKKKIVLKDNCGN